MSTRERDSNRRFRRLCWRISLGVISTAAIAGYTCAQQVSPPGYVEQNPTGRSMAQGGPVGQGQYSNGPTLQSASWTYIPNVQPHRVRINDLVTIRVDVSSQVTSEGDLERRKTALYDAIITDWISFIGLKGVKPSPQRDGDPSVSGQLNRLIRAEGELESTESLRFDIMAKVVDIRPNGNLVLAAQRTVQNNDETWHASLSGICRAEDIGPGNLVLSKHIYDLRVHKKELGAVRDGYRRGWFQKIFDRFHPF